MTSAFRLAASALKIAACVALATLQIQPLSAAALTKTQLFNYNNTYVNTNGIGGITGAILNQDINQIISSMCATAQAVDCPLPSNVTSVISVDNYAKGDGVTNDAPAFALAAAAAGRGGQVMLGPHRYHFSSNFAIPEGVGLTCALPWAGGQSTNGVWDYTTRPCEILKDAGVTFSGLDGSSWTGITELNSAITASPTTTRQAITMVANFAGQGFVVAGQDVALKNDLILGFATCVYSSNVQRPVLDYVYGDCTNGSNIDNAHDIARESHVEWWEFLTSNQSWTEASYSLTGAANNGSGIYRVSLPTNNIFVPGDTVWVSGVGGAVAANGKFTVAATGVGTVDLTGASVAVTTTGAVTTGNNYITGLGTTAGIVAGMAVVDNTTGGNLPATSVKQVWNGVVYLTANASGSGATDSLTFTSPAYTSGGTIAIDTNQRSGTGFAWTNSENFKCVECFEYGFRIGYSLGAGAGWGHLISSFADSNFALADPTTVAYYIYGSSYGTKIEGGGASSYAAPLIINSSSPLNADAHTITGFDINNNASNGTPFGSGSVIADIESGYVQLSGLTTPSTGFFEVGGALNSLTMSTSTLPNATLVFQGTPGLAHIDPHTVVWSNPVQSGSASSRIYLNAYGAIGDGITNDYLAFSEAFTACATRGGGDIIVGPNRYLTNTTLVIPASCHLRGEANFLPNQAFVPNFYLTQPYTILANAGITFASGSSDASAGLSGLVIAYPGLSPITTTGTDKQSALAQIASYSAGSGVVVPHAAGDTILENLMIVGYGKCLDDESFRTHIRNVQGDCTNGALFNTATDPNVIDGMEFYPALTNGVTNADQAFNITAIANDGGLVKVTVTGTATQLANGNTVYLAALGGRTDLASLPWVISNYATGGGNTTFDLVGSSFGGPTFTAGVTNGSTYIAGSAGFCTQLGYFGGQALTDTSSYIPGGTTLLWCNPETNVAQMSAAATNTNASDSITAAAQTYTSGGTMDFNVLYRSGFAFKFTNSQLGYYNNLFEFGYAEGFWPSTAADWIHVNGFGCDGSPNAPRGEAYCIDIDGTASQASFINGNILDYGVPFYENTSGGLSGAAFPSLLGSTQIYSNSRLGFEVINGAAIFDPGTYTRSVYPNFVGDGASICSWLNNLQSASPNTLFQSAADTANFACAVVSNQTFTGLTTLTSTLATTFKIVTTATHSASTAIVSATSSDVGANLAFVGDGASTPNKTIRVHGGVLQCTNSAYNAVICALTDVGTFSTPGGFASTGASPTLTTGSCSGSAATGGAVAGKFTAPSCVAGTIILSGMPTQANGYACDAYDQTTPADTLKQTANSASSATFAATTASNDVIVFKCLGF